MTEKLAELHGEIYKSCNRIEAALCMLRSALCEIEHPDHKYFIPQQGSQILLEAVEREKNAILNQLEQARQD